VEFDHVGIPVPAKRERMRYLEATRCWLTPVSDHPFRVEWLYFEPESEAPELVRTVAHVAYRTERLGDALDGHHVVAEPFDVFGEVRVAFIEVDGAPVEFVEAY
jgi:hypothetical protein